MLTVHQACCLLLFLGDFGVVINGGRGVPLCSSKLPNVNMSASSFKDTRHSPHESRINGPSAWCAKQNDVTSSWIKVSFGENVRVTGMRIQGSKSDFIWVKRFSIDYMSRDSRWSNYSKVFQGNSFSDYPSGKTTTFHPAFFAHDIRVHPLEVQGITTGEEEIFAPCLRMEVYGCRVFCPDPGKPTHGIRSGNNFLDGMTVNFTCTSPGYDLVGGTSIRCINGTWDKATPSCKARCTHPGIPKNAMLVKVDIRHAGITQYKCRKGFTLQGFANLTCKSGRWNRRLPSCIADDDDDDGSGSGSKALCSDPGVPVNGGRHGDNFIEGQTVQFICRKDFTLFGHSQITCANGSWSGIVPQCRVQCKDPGTPSNGGRHGNSFAEGQSVMFFCHQGYDLIGIDEPMCIAGQWSSGLPLCKHQAVGCGDLPTPSNGAKVVTKTTYLGRVKFRCTRRGYRLIGSSIRECHGNGNWSGTQPQCKKILRCPPRWKKHNNACYFFKHKTRKSQSWNQLKARCENYRASLLHLHDNREWAFVKRLLKSTMSVYAIGMYGQGGVWRWTGGGMVTVSKWDSSQRGSKSKVMCVVMQASNGLFRPVSCAKKLRAYICKKAL